jgi:hypothetical protein
MPPAKRFARNLPDTQRLALISLEGDQLDVRAQFNPREVQVDKSIAWNEQRTRGENAPHLEYTNGNSRTMTLELLFDGFEDRSGSVEPALDALHRMALAPNPGGRKQTDRMPPVLEVVNGPIKGFRCVIESLAVKATMFDAQMIPVRATVTLKLKEVTRKDLAAARELGGSGEGVYTGYQITGARDQAARDEAYREWERDRAARVAVEFPLVVPPPADDGSLAAADVDRYVDDKARRDRDDRAEWLADNGMTPE